MSTPRLSDILKPEIPHVHAYMLEALLADDETSRSALRKWAATVDIDNVGHASYRLIPALYARAGNAPDIAPLHGKMKGIYRYFFYRNNRFLAAIHDVLSAFVGAGIDFLLFKGTAVVIQYHSSPAVRSSADCDILIHPRDRGRAERLMAELGFSLSQPEWAERIPHSGDYKDKAGNGIDLHWHAMTESRHRDADDGFWQRSKRMRWKDLELRVLAPEDELLVAGINGLRERSTDRFDWLFDAATILKASPHFDWQALRQELIRRRLVGRFMASLALMEQFIPGFPSTAVEEVFSREIARAASRAAATRKLLELLSKSLEEDRRIPLKPELLLALAQPVVALKRTLFRR